MYRFTNELAIFNPFTMHAILGRIDNNALPVLAVQIMLYQDER